MKAWLRSAGALGVVALIGTTLLAGVDRLTQDRIAAQEQRVLLRQLGEIIPDDYDNDLLNDRIAFEDETHFPNGQTVEAWRARRAGQPLSVVLKFSAVRGYNGDISLLAGINANGTLRGVRVIAHRETPGLGDAIEAGKSDWIHAFAGRSLADPAPDDWAVKRDGGVFDQFTGATITPRAIVEALGLALAFHDANRGFLFDTPAAARESDGR